MPEIKTESRPGLENSIERSDVVNFIKLRNDLFTTNSKVEHHTTQTKTICRLVNIFAFWLVASNIVFLATAVRYQNEHILISFDQKAVYAYLGGNAVEIIGLFAIAFKWLFSKIP